MVFFFSILFLFLLCVLHESRICIQRQTAEVISSLLRSQMIHEQKVKYLHNCSWSACLLDAIESTAVEFRVFVFLFFSFPVDCLWPILNEICFFSFFLYLISFLSLVSDQNFYYQSPQRFQPTFQNPRNGFFPSNGVPGVPPGLVANLPRNPLGAYQEQTLFGDTGHKTNEDTTSDYFQYSQFPVSGGHWIDEPNEWIKPYT